jgi:hypothetical protein
LVVFHGMRMRRRPDARGKTARGSAADILRREASCDPALAIASSAEV